MKRLLESVQYIDPKQKQTVQFLSSKNMPISEQSSFKKDNRRHTAEAYANEKNHKRATFGLAGK